MNSYMYEFIFLLWIHAWIYFFIWKCIYNFKWFYFTPYFPNMNSLWINFSYNYHIFEFILSQYEFIPFHLWIHTISFMNSYNLTYYEFIQFHFGIHTNIIMNSYIFIYEFITRRNQFHTYEFIHYIHEFIISWIHTFSYIFIRLHTSAIRVLNLQVSCAHVCLCVSSCIM